MNEIMFSPMNERCNKTTCIKAKQEQSVLSVMCRERRGLHGRTISKVTCLAIPNLKVSGAFLHPVVAVGFFRLRCQRPLNLQINPSIHQSILGRLGSVTTP
jgi:hypothetical protein